MGEGNIGSKPEFKEFSNGNDEPRRLLRLNVYFDNSIPRDGKYEDRGGFWANVELWHKDAERYAQLYAKGVRVLVQGRMQMDKWEDDEGEENSAMKVQASRIGSTASSSLHQGMRRPIRSREVGIKIAPRVEFQREMKLHARRSLGTI